MSTQKKVGRHYRVGLRGDESAPSGHGAVGGWLASGVSEDLPDGGGGDAVSEPSYLAVDTAVAPCLVLDVEAQYESSGFGRGWGPSGSGLWGLGPVARDEPSVPADHGGGLDDQHHPVETAPVKATGQYRKYGPVGGCESGSLQLSLQNEDLMAQRQDLGITLVTTNQQQPHTRNQKPKQMRHDR